MKMKSTSHGRVLLILACSFLAWILAFAVLFPRMIAAIYAGQKMGKLRYFFFVGLVLQAAGALLLLLAPRGLPVWSAIRTAWMRYWFRPTPTIYLGLARLVCVGCALALMLPGPYTHFNHLEDLSRLPSVIYHPLLINRIALLPLGSEFQLSAQATLAVFWLTFAVGMLALMGFHTNPSLLLFTFGYAFLTAYKNSFGTFHQAEPILVMAIGALAMGPSGRTLSLDAWIESHRYRSGNWIGTG